MQPYSVENYLKTVSHCVSITSTMSYWSIYMTVDCAVLVKAGKNKPGGMGAI